MYIIFDKATADERRLEITHYSENILTNRFTGSRNFSGAEYPDLHPFAKTDFHVMEIMDGDTWLHFSGRYNEITGLNVSFDQYTRTYSLSVSIGAKDADA